MTITDEMVERAMDAANGSPHGREDYCTLSMMTRALEAVAPMLIAQLMRDAANGTLDEETIRTIAARAQELEK